MIKKSKFKRGWQEENVSFIVQPLKKRSVNRARNFRKKSLFSVSGEQDKTTSKSILAEFHRFCHLPVFTVAHEQKLRITVTASLRIDTSFLFTDRFYSIRSHFSLYKATAYLSILFLSRKRIRPKKNPFFRTVIDTKPLPCGKKFSHPYRHR